MGVREIYGPFMHSIRGTGQGLRLSTGAPANFLKRGG
jgi:hypothetical protein